ncbi:MAG: type IX secretion system sortase PorU [Bacteroidia bacterium]|nr:type IX secretion system sortase PorU [Bacteroidia bacterium]MCF8426994.1 type IX secretion system sortase PorU [Bacteroidia bacterium]MCF8445613.1 type IX secretion system sortase PorU [Bacteroidia bacterium]
MQFSKNIKFFFSKRISLILVFSLIIIDLTYAQSNNFIRKINWENKNSSWNFSEATFIGLDTKTPIYQDVIEVSSSEISEISIKIIEESDINPAGLNANIILNYYKPDYSIAFERGKSKLLLSFIPIRKIGTSYKKLEKFEIIIQYKNNNPTYSAKKKPIYASNSVLASGEWIKIGTMQNGVHRIDYATLRNLGINPDQIDPRNIQLFGHGAGMLPQDNSVERIDDLKEISILVQGETDGKFNPGDFIAFYGESQSNQWTYDNSTQKYSFASNLYCDTTYYFLHVGNTNGKRISKITSSGAESATINTYTYLYFYNNEKLNLIKSGKVWVGEEFDRITQQSFNVSIPYLITSEPIQFRSSVTSRSFVNSQFQINANGDPILTQSMGIVNPGYEQPYTSGLNISNTNFISNTSNFTLSYQYNKPSSGSIGWLDFFEIQAKAELRMLNGNFTFKDASNIGAGKISKFEIGSNRTLTVLDVSSPTEPILIEGTFANSIYSFNYPTDSLKTFCAYDGTNYLQPINAGKIANQNLHALSNPDGFIISHPNFLAEANRLAEFHRKKDNLTIHVINIQDIYNEFSAGSPDLCAVRDFLRMFYKRASTPEEMPKYALLFGRASYDYKYRQSPNSNFIPTFESWESFSPTSSYCSDDFLGFLDDNEGKWDIGSNKNELMDIGLGRLPVSNETEAAQVVDKIISYTEENAFGPWQNKLVFVADDEDNNTHQNQSDNLANNLLTTYPVYNIEKIFLDAYKKESTSGGARFPDAQKAINNSIQNGCLIFNYTGHGGEVGLTAERVLGIDDINNWTNGLAANGIKLPLFLTATCEFSRFDDPTRVSAGELCLLSPNGGAIGLFTTVRLVYSGQNEVLNRKFYENVGFDSISQLNPPRMGDIVKNTKNAYNLPDANTRNFTLLGDPFLMLSYSNNEIVTTKINGKDIAQFNDTLKALTKFEIKGMVTDKQGNKMTGYSGIIYPTIYDKFTTYSTLGNNPPQSIPMPFVMQNNVLFRGKASVQNGDFSFTFVVPKDISYEYGFGKLSYFTENGTTDGNGFNSKIIIGGTGDSTATDKIGPEIKLYLNDEKFSNGGLTNENPKLLVKLFDENGINTTGRGIGRDLTFVLDNNNTQAVVVNDYYQAAINSYQSGEVKYDISNLTPGKHTLKFRAYDVYNNPSEASVDFEVKIAENPSIEHLLNYPNPFNNATTFHFDHNLSGEEISVMIQIFTVSGRLTKTLYGQAMGQGSHFDQITWDGKDEYGDKLANGVYIYKVKLKSPGHKTIEKLEKLVILN